MPFVSSSMKKKIRLRHLRIPTCRTLISFLLLKSCTKKLFQIKIRFDGLSVEEAKSTTFEHIRIFHLAKYLGQPFTTGSWDNGGDNNAKTEIMRLESGEWESRQDYPFHSE